MSSGRSRFPGPDRFEYLQTLVTEFQDTDSPDAREQILANLANFSYDPKNIEDLQRLQVTELFLDMLTEESENLVEFGIGGLCNLSADRGCRDQILQSGRRPGDGLPVQPARGDGASARLRNLALVFLEDCCTRAQVERAEREGQSHSALGIPLPDD
ncbi:hypothetical protein AAFF_G00100670 [Aldrovandia affinis]|uniref:Armadillo repeat-containing protein 7 n=1 Tax=Aldrovandia affinis TaxID=143900 RepID=A0AAD7WB75_9TELE|nr:hypothetical protein AAFF_G00100670 [Aldrovandia affinis]